MFVSILIFVAYLAHGSTATTVEVRPVSAEHSRTFRKMDRYKANHAIDNNWRSKVITTYGGDAEVGTWLRLDLGEEFCVEYVEIWHYLDISQYRSTFTCSEGEEHCGSCEGYCGTKSPLTVTVYSSGDESGEAEQGCSRGDTVQIRNHQGHTLSFHEVKVYAKLDD